MFHIKRTHSFDASYSFYNRSSQTGVQEEELIAEKIYVAISFVKGIVDDVRVYRSSRTADRFSDKFEKEMRIKNDEDRVYKRDSDGTWVTWYECTLR